MIRRTCSGVARMMIEVSIELIKLDFLADAGEHRVRVAHGLVGAQYVAQVHDFAILVRDFDADGGLAGNR